MAQSRIFSYISIAAILAVLAGLIAFAVLPPAFADAKVKGFDDPRGNRVFVLFDKPVGDKERGLVRAFGGNIKYSYSVVNAIVAIIPEGAIDGLTRNPHVLAIEPDGQVEAVDIELDNSWGVKRIGAGDVHVSTTPNKGSGIKIGIIDSGINYLHPDLDGNYAGGYDFYDYDDDPMDVYGHGTHVAGTACAEDNDNGIVYPKLGVVGVAPECALYSLRVLNDDGVGYWSDIIAAVDYSTGEPVYLPGYWDSDVGAPEELIQGPKIDVINLSLGKDKNPGETVKKAFDNAYKNYGLVIVAAAGNSGNPAGKGNSIIYPAKFESVIAVAATDDTDSRASFSSTGDEVELAAPGVDVYSAWNDDTPYYGTAVCRDGNVNDCYKYGSGTSMASPHVAGTAALVIAAGIVDENGNEHINDEVRSVLQATADDLGTAGRDPQFGFGLVNALAAVFGIAPPATGTISGTVVDADTLLPISGAAVTDGTRYVLTDVDGNYTIMDVPEGTYTVTASAPDYEDVSLANVSVVADRTTTTGFALNPILYGSIDGHVTDIDTGMAIEGASVTDGARTVITDANGYYIISDVTEGTYTVTASAIGYQDESQTVSVVGDTTITADFVLQAVTEATTVSVNAIDYTTEGGRFNDKHLNIAVSLVDDFGNVVEGASVSIDLSLDSIIIASGSGTTDSNGTITFSLKNAPSGYYETKVTDVSAAGLTWDGITPEENWHDK